MLEFVKVPGEPEGNGFAELIKELRAHAKDMPDEVSNRLMFAGILSIYQTSCGNRKRISRLEWGLAVLVAGMLGLAWLIADLHPGVILPWPLP